MLIIMDLGLRMSISISKIPIKSDLMVFELEIHLMFSGFALETWNMRRLAVMRQFSINRKDLH